MKKRNSGSTLVAVLITVTVVSAMLGIVTNVTRFQTRNSSRTILRSQAIAYGDAVLERLYDQWRVAMVGATNSTDRASGLSTAALASQLSLPTSAQLTIPTGFSITSPTPRARRRSVISGVPNAVATSTGRFGAFGLTGGRRRRAAGGSC